MKKLLIALTTLLLLSACQDEARIASQNTSKAADNFEVARRIIFYNGITNDYILTIEGYCSIEPLTAPNRVAVICKDGKAYKKHSLGLSDNVTYFVEQVEPFKASKDFYRVTFKPSIILPDIRVQ